MIATLVRTFALLALAAACRALPPGDALPASGLTRGDDVPTFAGTHVGGSHDGRRACPVCVHGQKPSVAVWARPEALEDALATAAALERVLREGPAWQAAGYVVLLPGPGADDGQQLRRLSEARGRLGLERVFLVLVDALAEADVIARYRLPAADAARTTTIVYVNRRVAAVLPDVGAGAAAESRLREALAPLLAEEEPYAESAQALCGADEPGRRLEFWGRVLDQDGQPLARAAVTAYQTDAAGLYAPRGAGRNPRLRAVAVTDEGGWFRFTSIVPGPYPDTDDPAHVHLGVLAPAHELRHVTVWFEGDPRLTPRQRAARDAETVIVTPVPRADGALAFRVDVQLEGN